MCAASRRRAEAVTGDSATVRVGLPVARRSGAARRRLVAALGFASFLPLPAAHAEGLVLGGFDTSKDGKSAYVGAITPIAGGNLGQGPTLRVWADHNTYSYKSGGNVVDAKANGLEVALGYQTSSGENWGGISAGPRYTRTSLSPEDPGNNERGTKWGLKIQAGGEVVAMPNVFVNMFAAYTTGTEAYWARLRLLYRFDNGLRTGPELIRHGNTVYRASQAGWVLSGIKLGGSSEIGLKVGARRNEGQSTEPYGGVEFVSFF